MTDSSEAEIAATYSTVIGASLSFST